MVELRCRFERMNRIKEINAGDFVAVVQPGVILKTLQDAGGEAKGFIIRPIRRAAPMRASAGRLRRTPAGRVV